MVMTAAGGRPKLDPDPQVRAAILDAALAIAREDGIRALGIAPVLRRARLGTRAFYRHFDSKDQLIAAVFLQMARGEVQRLHKKMAGADPVRAVVAWIDGRLDLAFNTRVRSDLRSSQTCDRGEIRDRVQRFCLRGLGVAAEVIAEVLANGRH
jgi:AcrR family transcriptional regulator